MIQAEKKCAKVSRNSCMIHRFLSAISESHFRLEIGFSSLIVVICWNTLRVDCGLKRLFLIRLRSLLESLHRILQ